jgi:hypothetical protein
MKIKFSIAAVTACVLFLTMPLIAANKTTKTTAIPSAWPQENLSGKIVMVSPAQKLVVIQTQDGVPFDMDVTAKTRIKAGDRAIALKDLMQDINKPVSVQFVPERRGDVAKSIRISS